MTGNVNPCDEMCRMCGSGDVRHQLIYEDDVVRRGPYDRGLDEEYYIQETSFCYKAKTTHILHRCRCCGYEWVGSTLGSP